MFISVSKIIEEQIKEKMLAEATPDYAFKVINEAMVPVNRSKPIRSLILFVATFLGFLTSILIVLIRPNINIPIFLPKKQR